MIDAAQKVEHYEIRPAPSSRLSQANCARIMLMLLFQTLQEEKSTDENRARSLVQAAQEASAGLVRRPTLDVISHCKARHQFLKEHRS